MFFSQTPWDLRFTIQMGDHLKRRNPCTPTPLTPSAPPEGNGLREVRAEGPTVLSGTSANFAPTDLIKQNREARDPAKALRLAHSFLNPRFLSIVATFAASGGGNCRAARFFQNNTVLRLCVQGWGGCSGGCMCRGEGGCKVLMNSEPLPECRASSSVAGLFRHAGV